MYIQGCIYFPEIWQPPQNSRFQKAKSQFNTQDTQILGTTIKNFVTTVTWHMTSVSLCNLHFSLLSSHNFLITAYALHTNVRTTQHIATVIVDNANDSQPVSKFCLSLSLLTIHLYLFLYVNSRLHSFEHKPTSILVIPYYQYVLLRSVTAATWSQCSIFQF
jgi:hypothetical protein